MSQRNKGNQGYLANPRNLRDWIPQIKREVNVVTSNKCFNCNVEGTRRENVGRDLGVVHVIVWGM
jgi:hypothetical protein